MSKLAVYAVSVIAAATALPSLAQQQNTRILGKIERVSGQTILVKTAEADREVQMTPQTGLFAMSRGSMANIGKGSYLGVGATPQTDGTQKAIRVVIFPEELRGIGEGHRAWDRPGTTMTNATVDQLITPGENGSFTMKYKDGEQKIVMAPTTSILLYSKGSAQDLKPGAAIQITGVQKGNVLEAARVTVGRDGVQPN